MRVRAPQAWRSLRPVLSTLVPLKPSFSVPLRAAGAEGPFSEAALLSQRSLVDAGGGPAPGG